MSDTSLLDRLHPDNPTLQPSVLTRIRPPLSVRRTALGLLMLVPLLLVIAIAVPWQQSAVGSGRVIAYAPEERQQTIEAPISGRISSFFVQEGQRVAKGEPLVEIRDNDPALVDRMQAQLIATAGEVASVEEQIASYRRKLEATRSSRDLQFAEMESKIQELIQKRVGEQSELDVARLNQDRTKTLADEGLASTRELELAGMKVQKASATLEALNRQITSRRNAMGKARAEADGKIASVEAELQSAQTKAADVRRKQLDLEVKVARQSAQVLKAPRDGLVLRLHGGLGGGQVKAGDVMVTLVPDTTARAVEITIDGNDMPFVQQGSHARLVFEGWPAMQFVGLPGSTQGTFAGTVSFIDATDDGKGRFRVVVVPEDPEAWPAADVLRQGVRAKGFLLLGRVPLGYELWRQVNGFPPVPDLEKGSSVPASSKKPRAPAALK